MMFSFAGFFVVVEHKKRPGRKGAIQNPFLPSLQFFWSALLFVTLPNRDSGCQGNFIQKLHNLYIITILPDSLSI